MGSHIFRDQLRTNRLLTGLWCSLCSPIAFDVLTDSGFDWLLIDTEHSPNQLPDVLHYLQIAQRSPATAAIVRPAWNDAVEIKRLLDIGAQNLLIPFVQSASEAAQAVAATRYPPHGARGVTGGGRASRFGRDTSYFAQANDRITMLVQIETQTGLDNLEAIAQVSGVDGVFIGPSDLAASLGHLGNPAHPAVQAALHDAVKRVSKLGKPAGILTGKEEEARRYIEWGYQFVAVGTDVGVLAKHADALRTRFSAPG
jgi:4-hydroxy-2-oxoheptanedioate aldolase